MDRAKIIDRIRKLLALSGSPNRAEAESALRFAQELMTKYRVDMSAVERGEIIVDDEDQVRGALRTWDKQLLGLVAGANFCIVYRGRNWHGGFQIRIIGRAINIEVAWLMYRYVRQTALSESRKVTLKKRDKFLRGFVLGISSQLQKQNAHWGVPELAISERQAVEEFAKNILGDITPETYKAPRQSQAILAGYTSGSSVSLSRQMNGSSERGRQIAQSRAE